MHCREIDLARHDVLSNFRNIRMKKALPFTNHSAYAVSPWPRPLSALALVALISFPTSVISVLAAISPKPPNGIIHNPTAGRVNKPGRSSVNETLGKLPTSFEPNTGQAGRDVKFISRGNHYSLFLKGSEAVMALNGRSAQSAVLRMKLLGANKSAKVEGFDESAAKTNYFIGKDPKAWQTSVTNYGRVKCTAVYPGIDLVYYGSQQELEYDFKVAAGADPGRIRLEFGGESSVSLDARGDLVLRTKAGEIRHRKPVIYQEVNGQRREIPGQYVLKGNRQVGFQVGQYEKASTLIIDPAIVYSTYLGGSNGRSGYASVAVYTDSAT